MTIPENSIILLTKKIEELDLKIKELEIYIQNLSYEVRVLRDLLGE
jgi:hypothetical protein